MVQLSILSYNKNTNDSTFNNIIQQAEAEVVPSSSLVEVEVEVEVGVRVEVEMG